MATTQCFAWVQESPTYLCDYVAFISLSSKPFHSLNSNYLNLRPYKMLWRNLIELMQWKKKIQSLHLNKTWVLVPRLVGINVVRSKWVYWIKYKEDSFIVCFKAQLVTKIFTQTLSVDYDKMFSLVDKPTTILVTFLKINSPS